MFCIKLVFIAITELVIVKVYLLRTCVVLIYCCMCYLSYVIVLQCDSTMLIVVWNCISLELFPDKNG